MTLRLAAVACFAAVLFAGPAPAAEPDTTQFVAMDREECERLGLSLQECRQVYQAKMPMKKVHELLESGVTVSEYFTQPWKELGISEKKWMAKRRSGLSSQEIKTMFTKKEKTKAVKDTVAVDSTN